MAFECNAIFAGLPFTERGKNIFIDVDPKGEKLIYCSAQSVFIRNLKDPIQTDIVTSHSKQATVAKYAPSGYYIASGDVSGRVKIWDTVNVEHLVKCDYPSLGGTVKDIQWSSDSKKLAICGEGREKYAVVINWDTGTTVGDIIGHASSINSIDYKPTRPFRVVTAGEDKCSSFFEGPPFKYKNSHRDYAFYVNVVRYSPDGAFYVTGCSGGTITLYDGKVGDKIGTFGEPKAHNVGVYGLAFSPDGKQLMSVSADKTAKIWDVETRTNQLVFKMGSEVTDMQVSCVWKGEQMITVSLGGEINILDKENTSSPSRVIKGHQENINCVAVSADKSTIFSSDITGKVCCWDNATGECNYATGNKHGSQIIRVSVLGNTLISAGFDDTIRFMNTETREYDNESVSLEAQPRCVTQAAGGLIAVVTEEKVYLLRDRKICFSLKTNYENFSVSIHQGLTQLAVGQKDRVTVFNIENDTLVEAQTLECHGDIVCIAYSPDGAYLACGSAQKAMSIFEVSDYKPIVDTVVLHTAKVNDLAWSPDSRYMVSCGVDSLLILWKMEDKSTKKVAKAHQIYNITCVAWLDENTFVSGGFDHSLRRWTVTES